jgi:chromosome segregation ATPase
LLLLLLHSRSQLGLFAGAKLEVKFGKKDHKMEEDTLRGRCQIEIPDHQNTEEEIGNQNVEAIFHGLIEQLQKKVAENKELQISLKEKHRDFEILELELHELRVCLEERESDNKRLKSSLSDEKKFYDSHLRINTEVQETLYSMYKQHRKELQDTNRAIEGLEATLLRQNEELCAIRRERDSANQRIQDLENEKQIKELNNKEVESSVCSTMKKLAAASVVVGVVAAAGWWFLS